LLAAFFGFGLVKRTGRSRVARAGCGERTRQGGYGAPPGHRQGHPHGQAGHQGEGKSGEYRRDDAIAAWERLHESDKAMFFAALVPAAMTKRALEAELSVYISVLKV
jgi:hypothetical protein